MLPAAGFPSFVAIHTGLNLYLGNSHSLSGGMEGLLGLVVLALILWGVLFAALRWGGVIGKILWALPSAYAVFFLVRELVFPLPLVPLVEGMSFFPQVSTAYRAAEIITLVAALGLLLALRLRWTAPVAAITAVVFAVSILTATATEACSLAELDSPTAAGSPTTTTVSAADKPDVYQILFDTYQTVEFQYARKLKGIAPFDDFIHFNNNVSQYNWTCYSIPSTWTSTLYDPSQEEVGDWQSGWRKNRGILKTLKDHGYFIKVYGSFPFWTDLSLADFLRLDKEIVEEFQERAGESGYRVRSEEFLQLMKLRGLPAFLGKKAYMPSEKDKGVPPGDIYSFYSMVKFREMVASIKERPAGGNYTFIHMMVPHPPFALTKDGDYVGRGMSTRWGQVQLVDKLTAEFIAELKRLGRYDKSMIVIHADTGFRTHPDLEAQELDDKQELKIVPGWDHALISTPGPEWPPAGRAFLESGGLDHQTPGTPRPRRGGRPDATHGHLADHSRCRGYHRPER